MGIDKQRTIHLDEPDGSLHISRQYLGRAIATTAGRLGVSRIVSLGPDDRHDDHVTTFHATRQAIGLLHKHGRHVDHFSLNDDGHGDIFVAASAAGIRKKLGAMSMHRSQYPIRPTEAAESDELGIVGYAIDADFWCDFPFRSHILHGESYDLARPVCQQDR